MSRGITRAADRVAVFQEAPAEIKHRVQAATRPSTARYILLPHWDPEQAVAILHDHAAQMGQHTAATRTFFTLAEVAQERENARQLSYGPGRFGAPQVTPELMDLAHQGGFTLHDHVGDAPTRGYMVSRVKNAEQMQPLNTLRPEHISSFVSQHARELSEPNNYLGGWLDGKNFYLDVSSHRPTLDRAAHDAAQAHQLAIYDLDHGTSINTPNAVWGAGDPGLAAPDPKRDPLTAGRHEKHFGDDVKALPFYESMPAHDWLQHSLGDDEDWEVQHPGHGRHEAAAPPPGPAAPPLEYVKPAQGSTHKAEVWRTPGTSDNYLVKHSPPGKEFLADLDVAANQIATGSGVDAPPTFKTDLGKGPASAQYMYPGATDAFHAGQPIDPEKLSDPDMLTIQKHHALDWLLGNHDSHERQFIRTPQGQLVGIDKGQAFKYFNTDRLGWNHHPNGALYGENEPVYNTIYRNFAKGGRAPFDPRDGELGKYVQGLQDMDDDEYRETLRPYAEGAAQAKELGKVYPYDGSTAPRFKPNDPEAFLQAALDRKHNLMADLGTLHDKAAAHAATGTKIARARLAYPPDPQTLQSVHQTMGSHGAKVFADPQGQWLIKQPPPGAEFMVPLDQGTANLAHTVGLPGPETHSIPWKGSDATAIQMIPGAKQAWHKPPTLPQVHPDDLLTLQKHQALDWLISNHDGHVGNFLRTPQGSLVGIDKGQAAKYYGRDRLDNQFHPNFYAREPIYNNLWRSYAAGHPGAMHDPRSGELGAFVKQLQDIPDHELKAMFRPYAESAAHAGLLANVVDDDRRRGLGPATIDPNDPEAFLQAMVARKRNLANDLGAHYDKNTRDRHHALNNPGLKVWM